MTRTEQILESIIRLVAYSDLYDYALTLDEICRDFPIEGINKEEILNAISSTNGEYPVVISDNGYLFLKNREHLVDYRVERKINTEILMRSCENDLKTISSLPYIKAVIITGGACFENITSDDDLDLFLIVQANRLWIVDLYNRFIIRFWRDKFLKNKRTICVNYIIEDVNLTIPEKDFFTAHQIAHMKPFYDSGVWCHFLNANSWIREYFPNSKLKESERSKQLLTKRIFEILGDYLGLSILNLLLYLLRGKFLNDKRRKGKLKGLYTYRRLKANDIRRAQIASIKLENKLEALLVISGE